MYDIEIKFDKKKLKKKKKSHHFSSKDRQPQILQ